MTNYIVAFVLGIFVLICIMFIIVVTYVTVSAIRKRRADGSYLKYSPIMGVSSTILIAAWGYLIWMLYFEISKLLSGVL